MQNRLNIAAIVLAAGRSQRMGGPNKLVQGIGGRALVRIAAEAALGAGLDPVLVVTGHDSEAVTAALAGLAVDVVHNPDYADGMSTSLKTGLVALPAENDGAAILLGDMPGMTEELIRRLTDAFEAAGGVRPVVPFADGRRGNPVIWPRGCFADLMAVTGDRGGRDVLTSLGARVLEIAVEGQSALTDIDTPDALEAARRRFED